MGVKGNHKKSPRPTPQRSPEIFSSRAQSSSGTGLYSHPTGDGERDTPQSNHPLPRALSSQMCSCATKPLRHVSHTRDKRCPFPRDSPRPSPKGSPHPDAPAGTGSTPWLPKTRKPPAVVPPGKAVPSVQVPLPTKAFFNIQITLRNHIMNISVSDHNPCYTCIWLVITPKREGRSLGSMRGGCHGHICSPVSPLLSKAPSARGKWEVVSMSWQDTKGPRSGAEPVSISLLGGERSDAASN